MTAPQSLDREPLRQVHRVGGGRDRGEPVPLGVLREHDLHAGVLRGEERGELPGGEGLLPDADDALAQIHGALGTDGPWATTEIGGRTYAVVITPHA